MSRRPRAASRSVQELGTSANPARPLGNPEWTRDLEYVWKLRTWAPVQSLYKRARLRARQARRPYLDRSVTVGRHEIHAGVELTATDRMLLSRSGEWADHRARAMAMTRQDLVNACGGRSRTVRCGCGEVRIPVGCDQTMLCETCQKSHWKRWNRRIARSMDAHYRAAVSRWFAGNRRGYKPGIYLITFTKAHSGDIETDRRVMGEAWRELTKKANADQWWSAYALTWEVTPGRDGLGHVHMHVAALSSWVPYDDLRETWQRLLPGSIQPDVVSPKDARDRARQRGRRYDGPADAAYYLAKYVTKGVDPRVFTGQKAGELLAGFRGKRRVTTSLEFWKPLRDRSKLCRTCGKAHQSMGAPPSLWSHAPGPVFKALAHRVGWFVPRGTEQTELHLPDSS